MILELQICKIEPGAYEVHLSSGGEKVVAPTMHTTIAAALRQVALGIPDDFAHFVDVHYGGVSAGTIGTLRLVADAETVADRLVELVAAVRRSEEDLAQGCSTARAVA